MGVTIPDTPDFGTPVPRGATGVQSYGVVQPIQQDVAAWTYAAQSAKGSADSDARVMREVAADVDKWSASIDQTQAQDALNKLRARRQDLTSGDDGYMRIEGGNVLKKGPDGRTIYETLPARLQTGADEIGANLSPMAQKLYKQAATNEILAYKSEVARHGLNQTEKYQAGVYKDTAATLTDRALLSADDPKALETVVSSLEKATLARAEQLGIPGEAMARGVVSDVYKAVIKRAIDSGDSAKAIGAFDMYKGKLDGKDTLALEDQIKTLRTLDTAKTQAQSFTDSTYDGRTRAYESGAMEFNKLGSGAFGPYQIMPATWADLRAKNPDLNLPADMTKASREQHDAAHERFKAGNAASLKSAGFEVTPANLYLAHRFGSEGAVAVLRANPNTPLSSVLPANWQSQNPDMRGQTAGSFRTLAERRYAGVTDVGLKVDPLQSSVDRATGVSPPKNGPQYVDTRQMLLDADAQYDAATRRNMEVNATNEAQRRATQSALDINLATQKRQIEMVKLQLDISVDKWMQSGGPNGTAATTRPPPEIWNQLHYEKQKSIDATLAHNAKGQDAITDQQVWYELQRGLTSEDPRVREEYANRPLWEYKAKLSNQDFQEIAKMQGAVRKGDPDKNLTHVRNINQMVDDTLNRMGIDPTPKPDASPSSSAGKAIRFRRAVQDRITALEVETGKKSTPEQQQKIIDGMAIEVVTKKGWIWDSTQPRYELTIKDVPDAEKTKITDALRRQGYQPTDDMIIDLFARKNAKQKP